MTAYLSSKQIKDAFRLFDADGSGAIDKEELLLAFKSLGVNASKFEVEQMLRKADKDTNGLVEEAEFEAMLKHNMAAKNTEAEMKRAFELFTKGEKTMTSEHVAGVYEILGLQRNDERAQLFVTEASDGKFLKIADWIDIHSGKRELGSAAPAPAPVEEEDEY